MAEHVGPFEASVALIQTRAKDARWKMILAERYSSTAAITQPEQLTQRKSKTADRGLGVHRFVRFSII